MENNKKRKIPSISMNAFKILFPSIEENKDRKKQCLIKSNLTDCPPAELIGKSTDIMKMIIQNIKSVEERNNVELTSKSLYLLSRNIGINGPRKEFDMGTSFGMRWRQNNGLLFTIHDGEIEIKISPKYVFETNDKTKEFFKSFFSRFEVINIVNIYQDHLSFFGLINCFKRINTVKISPLAIQNGALEIFEKCSSLTPENLILHDNETSLYLLSNFENIQIKGSIPLSVKNISCYCVSGDILWLNNILKNNVINRIDKLVVTTNASDKIWESDIMLNAYKECVEYCNEIEYFINTFISNEIDKQLAATFSLHNTIINLNFLNGFKLEDINVSRNFIEYHREEDERLGDESSRILADPGIYLNVKRIKIANYTNSVFSNYKCEILSRDLSKMVYLNTLVVDFNLFSSKTFKNFCSKLNQNIKNIELQSCENLTHTDLTVLSVNFKELKNLSLFGLKNLLLEIGNITLLFKNLNGISLVYTENDKDVEFFENLKQKKGKELCNILNWPKISFFHYVSPLSSKGEKIINSIEKATPRQPGRFTVEKIIQNEIFFCGIVIQKRTNCFDEFSKLFFDRLLL